MKNCCVDFNACLEEHNSNSTGEEVLSNCSFFWYLWSKYTFMLPHVGNVLCETHSHFVPCVTGESPVEKIVRGPPGKRSQVEAHASYLMGWSSLLISQLWNCCTLPSHKLVPGLCLSFSFSFQDSTSASTQPTFLPGRALNVHLELTGYI